MSEEKQNASELRKIFIRGVPFYLTSDNRLVKQPNTAQSTTSQQSQEKNTKKSVKVLPVYKEDVIFESTSPNDEFLKGEYQKLVLKNRLHRFTNSSRTVASFYSYDNTKVEKTSTNVANLIGQKNYDAVFVALCSVISQELKVRAMLALLTHEKTSEDASSQTDFGLKATASKKKVKTLFESSCQTDEISPDLFNKKKPTIKRKVTPFVVKEELKEAIIAPRVKRIIINPHSKEDCDKINLKPLGQSVDKGVHLHPNPKGPHLHPNQPKGAHLHPDQPLLRMTAFPDLKTDLNLDDDSNISNVSIPSICSDVLNHPEVNKLLNITEQNILKSKMKVEDEKSLPCKMLQESEVLFCEDVSIVTYDGTKIAVPVKPEDQFHLATPEILEHITTEERIKLIKHQAFIDWKLCLETDEDGNTPLHLAVLHEDLDLIRRQALMLRARRHTLDLQNSCGMTPLKLSIQHDPAPECTTALLELGADPLLCDEEQRTCLHHAAEASAGHVRAVLRAIIRRARQLVSDHFELQQAGPQTDEEVARDVMLQASVMCDTQGYTPLMLASKLGKFENVRLLVERSPETVNTVMPNSGNTALFVAVAEACMSAADSGNKTQVSDNYRRTIEILIENGADSEIENHSGTKISDLLQEFNINSLLSLSMFIANKVTSIKFFDKTLPSGSDNFRDFILLKDPTGNVKIVKNDVQGKRVTQDNPKRLTEDNPKRLTEDNPKRLTEDNPKRLTEDNPKRVTEEKPKKRRLIENKSADKPPVILQNVPINTKTSTLPMKKVFLSRNFRLAANPKKSLLNTTKLNKSTDKGDTKNRDTKQAKPRTVIDKPANIILKNKVSNPPEDPISLEEPTSTSKVNKPVMVITPYPKMTLNTSMKANNVPITVIKKRRENSKEKIEISKDLSKTASSSKEIDVNEPPVTKNRETGKATVKRKASGPLDLTVNELDKKQKNKE